MTDRLPTDKELRMETTKPSEVDLACPCRSEYYGICEVNCLCCPDPLNASAGPGVECVWPGHAAAQREREAAFEEAARLCDPGVEQVRGVDTGRMWTRATAMRLAEAIRALAKRPQGDERAVPDK